jgi:hypothetical protein
MHYIYMSSSPRHIQKPVQNDNAETPTLRSRFFNYVKAAIASRIAARAMSWALKDTALSPLTEGIRGAHTSDSDPNIQRVGSDMKEIPLALKPTDDRLAHIKRFLIEGVGKNNSLNLFQFETLQGQEHVAGLPKSVFQEMFGNLPTEAEIDAARQRMASSHSDYETLSSRDPNYSYQKIPHHGLDALKAALSHQSDGRGRN